MRQKEGQLDDKIKKYCDKHDIFYMKTNGGGIPDCIICKDGHFIAFETKVDKNTLSELQKFFINKIKRNYGIALEIRDLETAIYVLEHLEIYTNK